MRQGCRAESYRRMDRRVHRARIDGLGGPSYMPQIRPRHCGQPHRLCPIIATVCDGPPLRGGAVHFGASLTMPAVGLRPGRSKERWWIMLRRSFGVSGLVLAFWLRRLSPSREAGRRSRRRGGMFGRGFNPTRMPGAGLMLLNSPDVQKEIAVTDDQKTQVTDLQQKTMEDMRSQMRRVPGRGNFRDMSDEERQKSFDDMRRRPKSRARRPRRSSAKSWTRSRWTA